MARPARPWFRFYVESFGDPKMLRLTPEQRWLWVAVLGAARQSPTPGTLLISDSLPMTDQELARLADVSLKCVRAGLEAMTELGMVERTDGAVVVKNWNERQYESDTSAKRTAEWRHNQRHSDGDCDVTVTPIVTDQIQRQIQRTDLEGKQAPAKPSPNGTNGKRGTRIPAEFTVTEAMQSWAEQNCPGVNWDRETIKFVNYWASVPGSKGVKLDWVATWRTWLLNSADRSVR